MSAKAIFAGTAVTIGIGLIALPTWKEEYRKEERVKAHLDLIASGLERYAAEQGRFPDPAEGLSRLVSSKLLPNEVLTDPWGRRIEYKCLDEQCKTVRIWSLGDPAAAQSAGRLLQEIQMR